MGDGRKAAADPTADPRLVVAVPTEGRQRYVMRDGTLLMAPGTFLCGDAILGRPHPPHDFVSYVCRCPGYPPSVDEGELLPPRVVPPEV